MSVLRDKQKQERNEKLNQVQERKNAEMQEERQRRLQRQRAEDQEDIHDQRDHQDNDDFLTGIQGQPSLNKLIDFLRKQNGNRELGTNFDLSKKRASGISKLITHHTLAKYVWYTQNSIFSQIK